MAPEDVVDVLRRIHRVLVPGGALIDMRPGLAPTVICAAGRPVGRLDDREFVRDNRAVDRALRVAEGAGLFARETAACFAWVHRFDSADELLAEADGWRRMHVGERLRRRLGTCEGPFEVLNPAVACRLRALP